MATMMLLTAWLAIADAGAGGAPTPTPTTTPPQPSAPGPVPTMPGANASPAPTPTPGGKPAARAEQAQALTRLRAGRLEEAAQLFARAAEHDPGNASIATDYGFVLARLGKRAEAEQVLRCRALVSRQGPRCGKGRPQG